MDANGLDCQWCFEQLELQFLAFRMLANALLYHELELPVQ